jgi:hypothetical protein
MPDIRRDLKQAIMTGAETTILAVAMLTGVFGAEVSSPPGNAIFWCPWFYQSHCAVRTVRTINVPINNSAVSPTLGTGSR